MPTFKVGLLQKVWEETTIQVDAATREEAEEKALEVARDSFDGLWNFLENVSDAPDVISVEEVAK